MARQTYFADFSLVEVQQTFYQPPRTETLSRWLKEAPPGFEFTLKAWQLITHTPSSPTYRRLRQPLPKNSWDRYGAFRPTDEVAEAWRVTLEAARHLAASVIVFQCPASFTPEPGHVANLRRFLTRARADAGVIRLAWEPRGAWPHKTFAGLCAEFDLLPIIDPFKHPRLPRMRHYFRLHGVTGYRYRYSDVDLNKLWDWCEDGTYCLFNNMNMAEDARRFLKLAETRRYKHKRETSF